MALGAASAMHAGRATAAWCKALVYCRHAPLGCGREGLHCADSMCERAGALRAACWTGWLRALGAGGGLQAWRAAHPSPAARRLLKVAAQEQGVEAAQHECRGRVPACIAPDQPLTPMRRSAREPSAGTVVKACRHFSQRERVCLAAALRSVGLVPPGPTICQADEEYCACQRMQCSAVIRALGAQQWWPGVLPCTPYCITVKLRISPQPAA